jgi:hypothetical protein
MILIDKIVKSAENGEHNKKSIEKQIKKSSNEKLKRSIAINFRINLISYIIK